MTLNHNRIIGTILIAKHQCLKKLIFNVAMTVRQSTQTSKQLLQGFRDQQYFIIKVMLQVGKGSSTPSETFHPSPCLVQLHHNQLDRRAELCKGEG